MPGPRLIRRSVLAARALDRWIERRSGGLFGSAAVLVLLASLTRLVVYFADRIYYNPITNLMEIAMTGLAAVVLLALTASFITSFLVIHLVLVANYLKFFFLREGVLPSDLGLLTETWQGAGGSIRIAAVLAVVSVAATALLLANARRWKGRLAILAVVGAGALVAGQQAPALKANLFPGDYERYWQPGSEFQARGFFTAFAMSALNTKVLAQEIQRLPLMTHPEAHDLRGLSLDLPRDPADLHIVLLESFIAPEDMAKLAYRPLPDAPATRTVDRGSPSYGFSPTEGGKTARAEFEVLCGLPDFEMLGSITFNQLGGGKVGCLPAILSRHGYRSVASQALPPSFFNMGQAYRSLGFDELRFESSFDMSDRDGPWLSNDSALKQNLDFLRSHVAPRDAPPIFNYVVLGAGHFPFERDEARRPMLVTTEPADVTAGLIVNHSLHTLDALADWLDGLRALGRPAVVLLFSDHLPPVPAAFLERVGYFGFSGEHPITARRTYLLVLKDFEPLAQANLAMWEFPYLAADLLGDASIPPHPSRDRLMLVSGRLYDRSNPGDALCTDAGDAGCEVAIAEIERMRDAYLDLVKRSHIHHEPGAISADAGATLP